MALQEVANALRAHGVKIDFERVQDLDTRKALEEIERLLRRMVNDIVRNAD